MSRPHEIWENYQSRRFLHGHRETEKESFLVIMATDPAPAPAVEGWRMVPEEPTEAMKEAAMGASGKLAAYAAMLAAAPAAPTPQTEEGAET